MMTALMIVVLVLMLVGLVTLGCGLVNGCPFAWVWFACNGLGSATEAIGTLLMAIAEGLNGE